MANVPEHDPSLTPDSIHPTSAAEISSDPTRRAFLGSMGATSMGALFTCFSPTAHSESSGKNESLRIDTIQDCKTLRFDTIPVPGGKEVFLDQQAIGANGVTMLTRGHSIRTDTEVAYTMHVDIVVQFFAPGRNLTGAPDSSRTTNLSISGIKGEVESNIRKDHMTITFMNQDGTSTRMSQEVPVRLDVSQYDDMSPDQLMRVMSEAHKNGGRLPF